MDYFYNNPETFASQRGYDENMVQGFDSSSSSYSPQILDQTFPYVDTNTALYPETNQSWLPLELDNLIAYDETQLQLMEAEGSSSQSPDGEKENPENTKLVCLVFPFPAIIQSRRRAQNRASQRAFRERKDRHLKGLEYQLEHLGEKHHDLMQSYMKQSESVMRLNSRLAELRGQIHAIKSTHHTNGGGSRSSRSRSGSESFSTGNGDSSSNGDSNSKGNDRSSSQNAESFDAFSSLIFSSSPLQRLSPLEEREAPFWRDTTPRPSEPDDEVLDENGLPAFEDLLRLK